MSSPRLEVVSRAGEPAPPATGDAGDGPTGSTGSTSAIRQPPGSGRPITALLPWALLAVPVAGYFAFVAAYGVNTIVLDQWTDVALLQKAYAGHLSLSALWAAHNENRMLFPNLVVLALAHLDHFDTVVEMYIGAALLTLTCYLVIATHRRHVALPLAWYLPVPALLCTLSQYYNTLTGFQLAWYMSLAASVGALSLLDRRVVGGWVLGGAVLLSVVGSYSTIEGLFVWPAGVVLLLLRRCRWQQVATWAVAGAAVTVLYAIHLSSNSRVFSRFDVHHPATLVGFVLLALGDPSSVAVGAHVDVKEAILMAAGGLVLVACGYALWRASARRDEPGAVPFSAALIVIGLVFTVVTALGRAFIGLWEASASRFVTFDVLPIVGCYLVFLALRQGPAPSVSAAPLRRAVPFAVCGIVLVPAVAGAVNGISGGRSTAAAYRTASDVIVNLDKASNLQIFDDVYPLENPQLVRGLVPVARAHHLSLFDTSQVTFYEQRGLVAPTGSSGNG